MLKKINERFCVECMEDDYCGKTTETTYTFKSPEDVERFLDGESVKDAYGTIVTKRYYEVAQSIYSKAEYERYKDLVVDKERLMEIGNDIASLWGGSCYDFEIDKDLEEIAFFCVEHGEEFTTTMSFAELEEEYSFTVA